MRSRLEEKIYSLECELLKPEVRRDALRIGVLLSPDFLEYCSSGRVYRYKEGDIFENAPETEYHITDFEARKISQGYVLALYRVVKNNTDSEIQASLRCSVWKRQGKTWRMIFHQGTLEQMPG